MSRNRATSSFLEAESLRLIRGLALRLIQHRKPSERGSNGSERALNQVGGCGPCHFEPACLFACLLQPLWEPGWLTGYLTVWLTSVGTLAGSRFPYRVHSVRRNGTLVFFFGDRLVFDNVWSILSFPLFPAISWSKTL